MSTAVRATSAQPSGQPHSAWQSGALQAIFAVFLGLILAFVVGVGVSAFHPNPADQTREQLEQLYQQQQLTMVDKEGLSGDMSAAQQRLQAQILRLEDVARAQEEEWAGTTSVVVIVIATLLLVAAVALARVTAAWVFSTGLLLGGIFTMLYGVAISMMSGQSVWRFVLLLVALGITSAVGYLRFVRSPGRRPSATPTATGGVTSAGSTADLDGRLTAVETSLDELRRTLRGA